jgi:hypothetical protein
MIKKYDAVEILPGFGLPGGGGFKWFAARDEDEDGLVKLAHKHSMPSSQYILPSYQLRQQDAPADSLLEEIFT